MSVMYRKCQYYYKYDASDCNAAMLSLQQPLKTVRIADVRLPQPWAGSCETLVPKVAVGPPDDIQ